MPVLFVNASNSLLKSYPAQPMKLTSPDEDNALRLMTAGAAMAPASTTPLFRTARRAALRFARGERKSPDMPLTSLR